MDPPLRIVFIIGGPGSGKTTQCQHLVTKHPSKYIHISIGDILRAEVVKGDSRSKWARIIAENMKQGIVGDKEMTVGLLENKIKELMISEGEMMREKVLLIDGFPRKLDRAKLFEKRICTPICVVRLLDDTTKTISRLRERGLKEGARADDVDDETLQRRISASQSPLDEVNDYYVKKGKKETQDLYSHVIIASRKVEEVMVDFAAAIETSLLVRERNRRNMG